MVRTTHCAYLAFASSIAPFTTIYEPHQHNRRLVVAGRSFQTMTSNQCCSPVSASNSVWLSTSSQQQIQEPLANEEIIQTSAKQLDDRQLLPEIEPSLAAITSTTDVRTTTGSVPKNTFYRRSLPDTCVAFSSKLGRKNFESAMRHRGLKSYFHLMEQYTTQSEPAYCGISTLVIALNALAVDPRQIWKGSWRWYEESMLNCCIDLEQAKETGITMSVRLILFICELSLLLRVELRFALVYLIFYFSLGSDV